MNIIPIKDTFSSYGMGLPTNGFHLTDEQKKIEKQAKKFDDSYEKIYKELKPSAPPEKLKQLSEDVCLLHNSQFDMVPNESKYEKLNSIDELKTNIISSFIELISLTNTQEKVKDSYLDFMISVNDFLSQYTDVPKKSESQHPIKFSAKA